MLRKLLKFIILLTILFGGACSAEADRPPPSPLAIDAVYSSGDYGNHWRINHIAVYDGTTDPLYDVPAAIDVWEEVGNVHLTLVDNERDADIVIIEEGELHSSWLGQAGSCEMNGHIIKSEVRLNTVTLDANYSIMMDVKQHVLCHELGHALGLPHNIDVESCKNPCSGVPTIPQWNYCMGSIRPGIADGELLAERYNTHNGGHEEPVEHLKCNL